MKLHMLDIRNAIRSWLFIRPWRLITGTRYESATDLTHKRARILHYCRKIAEAERLTSDRFACGNYRDSAMHGIYYWGRKLAKEVE